MAPPVREIPGYYYDKEKKKYFKIQPIASSSGAYSSHHVKRLKMDEEMGVAKAAALERQRGRIKRSKALLNPLGGGLMFRSSGRTDIDASQILAAGLVQQGQIPARRVSNSIFVLDPRPERLGAQSEVWQAREGRMSVLCTQLGGYNDSKVPPEHLRLWAETSRIDLPMKRSLSRGGNGMPTSMSINESCRQVATTWVTDGHEDLSQIRISRLSKISSRGENNRLPGPGHVDELTTPMIADEEDRDIFCSVAAPAQSSLRFAFGTSSGILTLDKERDELESIAHKDHGIEAQGRKDVLALEFLTNSHDHNILLSGSRLGRLNIIDLRDQRFDNSESTLHHPSSITHIRHLRNHQIIVAGLNSSLYQYDMRFIRNYVNTNLQGQNNSSLTSRLQSRPIITYNYHNSATINIGFDVDLESGIVAAAQEPDSYHSAVQLFSLYGGHKLRSPAIEKDHGPTFGYRLGLPSYSVQPIKCLRFARDIEGRMKSLYVAASKGLLRYAWAESEEPELAVLSSGA